jgi:hypothetical protein
MEACVGEPAKQEIYHRLEADFGLAKLEIPTKIDVCCLILERIFGESNSILEVEMMKCLSAKTGIVLNWPVGEDLSFAEHVTRVRLAFMERATQKPRKQRTERPVSQTKKHRKFQASMQLLASVSYKRTFFIENHQPDVTLGSKSSVPLRF